MHFAVAWPRLSTRLNCLSIHVRKPAERSRDLASRRRHSIVFAAVLLLILAFAGCGQQPPAFKGSDVTSAPWGRELRLTDPDGRIRTLDEFHGKVVMVFFGFTYCPDVCPTALSRAAEVRKRLGSDSAKVQVIFVTVDPERDTPSLLREYTHAFDPTFLGLRGSDEEIRQAAAEFRVFYERVPTGSSYTMNHSALTYVFDTKGQLRLVMDHGQGADDFVADIRTLLRQAS